MNEKLFLLLQICDSQFPIGSYTQSYGLETYVQKNLVFDGATAESFISANMKQSLVYSELLPVKLAYSYGLERNMPKIIQLEQISRASRSPRELREASLKLGKRFVRTVEGLPVDFDQESLDFFHEYQQSAQTIGISHPVAYGVYCSLVDMGENQENSVLSHYFYSQLSAFVTNAVKLVPLSQTEGQKILCSLHQDIPSLLEKIQGLTEEDLFLSCPAFDLRSMEHERLYSRLYMS